MVGFQCSVTSENVVENPLKKTQFTSVKRVASHMQTPSGPELPLFLSNGSMGHVHSQRLRMNGRSELLYDAT